MLSETSPSETLPALAGVRVLDLSHALAGPYCTLLLAQYGATVYKLESPDGGEVSRGWGPPFVGDQSGFFLGLNFGKQGVSIDLKRPEGIELCLRLIEKMDVVIENFRPGTAERLGLGHAAARARNPRLVYCSISGYGQDGPARNEAAMDLVVQCASGLVSITGPEGGPLVRSGYPAADVTSGMFALIGVLMALRAREQSGQGQFVDVSMFDSMVSAMASSFATYLASGVPPKPLGTAYISVVPYGVFHSADRDFAIAVGSEKLWSDFCKVIERPELERHAEFATNPVRSQNRKKLEVILGEIFIKRPVADWLARLSAAGIPCSLVRDLREVVEHPQSAHRAMFPTLDHATAGSHRVTGQPVKISPAAEQMITGAPTLGQHTRSMLATELGLEQAAIDDLKARGIIFEAARNP